MFEMPASNLLKKVEFKRINGIGTIYYELNINRKDEVKKLINLDLIQNIFKDK